MQKCVKVPWAHKGAETHKCPKVAPVCAMFPKVHLRTNREQTFSRHTRHTRHTSSEQTCALCTNTHKSA